MAKQEINLGTEPNARNGDSLRSAFAKINQNFDELYTVLGINGDNVPNLGAFEFNGSIISTTDSSSITIDQATTITGDLTVGGDITPSSNLASNLGSPTNKFHSLYVGTGSVYIGDAKLSLESGKLNSSVGFSTDNLTVGGVSITVNDQGALLSSGGFVGAVAGAVEWNNILDKPEFAAVATSGSYDDLTEKPTIPDVSNFITADDIPSIPADIADLTDNTNLLSSGGSLTISDSQGTSIENVTEILINGDNFVEVAPGVVGLTNLGGTANLTITVPGNTYKGFGARYGKIHGNGSIEELTVSKIVIYKEEAVTNSIISDNSDIDEFSVTGLGDSDVVAMFILYGDTNGEKSLDTLRTFARAAIDTVILANGVEGSVNTIADMRSAFYANINNLTAAAGGLVANFQFYNYNNQYQVIFDTTGQGTGSGFDVTQLSYNFETGQPEVSGWGNGGGYTQGDVIIIPGTSINYDSVPLLSPDNDVTITITQVNVSGFISSFTVSGTLPPPPPQWPTNSISDGGQDQYDTGNYINTNLAQEISYNDGVIVEDAEAQFGTGSKYVVVYDESIFGFIATGSSATSIGTSGGSGADGSSTTDTGELLATDRVYDPALTNLTLTNDPLRAVPVTFTKADYATANDVDVIEDDSTLQIGITRGNANGIYNPFTEEGWNSSVSPQGTLWSVGYQGDLRDITRRNYTNFYAAYGSGNLGNVVPGSKAVMYVPSIEKYYLVEWLSWTQGGNGGGFSYTRTEIDVTQVEQGIQFADGTSITSAEGLGRVKSTATGNRRIEEVTGYKEVSVTERNTVVLTTTASRSVVDDNRFWVDITTTTIDDVIENDDQYELDYDSPIEFSLDNVNWYVYNGGYSSTGNERGFNINNGPVTYNQGDTIYFRYTGGGFSQTWWNKNELPGGGTNFRGAVIDYHAYTGDGTIIGTIHIVDDDGDENITHTEVSSGSTDSENDDLWVVTNEGSIRYRRTDGAAKTLKIHWTAKVFYGSEYYD